MTHITEKDLQDGINICNEQIKLHEDLSNSKVLPAKSRQIEKDLVKMWQDQKKEIESVQDLKTDPEDSYSEIKNNHKRLRALQGVSALGGI